MQPDTQPTLTPADITRIQHMNKQKMIWGIVCLAAPTVLLVLTFLLYALVNFIAYDNMSALHSIINVVLFFVGLLGFITWLPGIIVGIILLSTRRHV